ncbi:MAG: hypothetical protein ABIO68_01855 [Sphingomicrobium sp.]
MPHEIIGEVVGQVVQGVGEVAVDEVHRKFGWRGCLLVIAAIGVVAAGLYFALR